MLDDPFMLVKLLDAVTITGPEGPQGDPGNDGADGADGVVQSIVEGTNITVDDTDPANPIVSATIPGGDVDQSFVIAMAAAL